MKDMAKPLKWLGVAFAALGGLVFAGALFAMHSQGDFTDAPGLAIPLLFFLAGAGLVLLSRRMTRDVRFEIGHLVFWIFGAVGAVCAVGGVALAMDDPAGLFLVAFGAVFMGAAWLARRVFTTPPGMKSVAVETTAASVRDWSSGARRVTSTTFVHVPEDATEAEVEAARRNWAKSRLDSRPDWVSGRIEQEAKRTGASLTYGAFGAAVLAAILAAAGWFFDGFFFIMAGFVAVGCVSLAWMATGQAARRKKFGLAEFVMKSSPVAPGERIEGVIETRAARRSMEKGDFRLTLSCRRTVEYRSGDKTRTRTDTLWSDEAVARASGEQALKVKVRFDTPADLPGATLASGGSTRIRWVLQAEADAPGIDFLARFTLPVLTPPETFGPTPGATGA